jgi:GNAT superfamily N-acetyltransferase
MHDSLMLNLLMAGANVRLRLIRAADELSAAALLAGEYAEWARGRAKADHGIDLESESEARLLIDLDAMRVPCARLYVAEVDGEPVGIGGLKPLTGDEAELKRMYVRASSRGLGIGRTILERLIDDARTLGYRTIRLESAAFIHEAHALYRRFGFLPTPTYAGREFEQIRAVDEISVFMALDLSAD